MTFQFDDKKSFDENLEAFLVYMEKLDADMGPVLRAHFGALLAADDDAARRAARTLFNAGVKTALDKHLKELLAKDNHQ